ncbi:hypothetical protein [uncultured Eudoraea sp.]|uniref:hypothetical protein n=1 Tax=uncultured Eudoraea sp. TaxID=1035614 RepID=UPI002605B65F|nr:hypothetical protein [uncultured Eudoraea sp.]
MDSSNKSTQQNKIGEVNWQELYILTDHWKSDLEFYKDDLRFLHHLIDKYIIWITKDDNLNLVKNIQKNLFEIRKKSMDLMREVNTHQGNLGLMVENPVQSSNPQFIDDHEDLEDKMSKFVKLFRSNRKEVFSITEYIIDSEELPNILKN